MNRAFYLLSLTLSGVKSLKNPITLEFYKKNIGKTFDPDLYRITAVFGENGSGKSAIVTAVRILKNFLTTRDYLSDVSRRLSLHELVNRETHKVDIACTFRCEADGVVYRYAFSFQETDPVGREFRILSEKLECRTSVNGRFSIIFEADHGKLISLTSDADMENILGRTQNLLDRQSVVPILVADPEGCEYGSLYAAVLNLFLFGTLLHVSLEPDDWHDVFLLRKVLQNPALNAGNSVTVSGMLEEYVLSDQEKIPVSMYGAYEKRVERLSRFVKLFKPSLQKIDIEKKENGEFYDCRLQYNYGSFSVDAQFESTGIRKLPALFDALSDSVDGAVVFVDEMDANMNSVYMNAMLEHVINDGSGQLIFTCHSLEPMDLLKNRKKAIDFISSDGELVSWAKSGNLTPQRAYRAGTINHIPFNIDSTDFIGILGG
ncbi:MAG: hypothetical protein VZT48_03415 [Bulleidia sp.]|nr:hypothetical protein [Bulleidia sp.]